MIVNTKLIKTKRKNKLWSQEQLAEVSGLSARTIQRIESLGNASPESIKSLSCAFECDSSELILPKEFSTDVNYSNSQFGLYIHLAVLFTWFIAFIPLWSKMSEAELAEKAIINWSLALVSLVLVSVSILFFNLTVKVNKREVVWYFGPKFWCKSLPIGEVIECRVVQNSLLNGFGIRDIGTGWLYNVSGLLAVEMKLKSGSVIRLGTNEPEFLKNAIESARLQNGN